MPASRVMESEKFGKFAKGRGEEGSRFKELENRKDLTSHSLNIVDCTHGVEHTLRSLNEHPIH